MGSLSAKNFLHRRNIFPSLEKLIPYFFILPSVLFLGAILGFPILYSIVISFQKYNLATLVSGKAQFIGLQNYIAILENPQLQNALIHSLIFTFFSILFQFTIGLGLAILLNKSFPLNNVMRGVLLSGWQVPSVVTGTVFLWLFNLDYGLVNFLLSSLKLVHEPIAWFFQPNTAMVAVVIANIWLGIPFNVILLSAGLAGLPEDVERQLALLDGRTREAKQARKKGKG